MMKRKLLLTVCLGIAIASQAWAVDFKYKGLSYTSNGATFAKLSVSPAQINGTRVYCTDSTVSAVCAGGGHAAWATLINNGWNSGNNAVSGTTPDPLNQAVIKATGTNPSINDFSVNGAVNVKAFGAKGDGATDDSGSFETAAMALGSQGGTIIVPASRWPYVWASQVTFPRNVILAGQGVDASTISCTSTTAGAACAVWADGSGTSAYRQGGARDITFTGSGTSHTTTGVFTGGDPTGVLSNSTYYGDFLQFVRVKVQTFGTGYTFGSNSFNVTWRGSHLVSNGTNYITPFNDGAHGTNMGEMMRFTDTDFNNASVHGIVLQDLGAAIDNIFENCSVDFNASPAILGNNATAIFCNCHFEQTSGDIFDFSSGAGVDVVIDNGKFSLDGAGSFAEFGKFAGTGVAAVTRLVIRNVLASAGGTVTDFVHNTSSGSAILWLDNDFVTSTLTNPVPNQAHQIEFAVSGLGTGGLAQNSQVAFALPIQRGHFVSLTCINQTGGTCTTAPTINVNSGANDGTPVTCSNTVQTTGLQTTQAETLPFNALVGMGIYVSAAGSGCTAPTFLFSAQVSEP